MATIDPRILPKDAIDALGMFDGEKRDEKAFALTEMEKQSDLWKKLKAHAESRIARHRAKNDHDKTPEKTSRLRGRIAESKYFASLDNPSVAMQLDTDKE